MTVPVNNGAAAVDHGGQNEVLTYLSKAARRIDTHASIVFLEPNRVLKIKRAVRLPYLDYSTIDKRKRACEDELAVNRRHAPAIYRRVVPITRERDGLAVRGHGDVVEWAVEMARFDENDTFEHLAVRGGIGPDLAEALAAALLESHGSAEVAAGSDWLASLPVIIDRNTYRFRADGVFRRQEIDELNERSHRALTQNMDLLRRRATSGQVRCCHGDAHLANIALIDGKPVLFDAIEFDPAIATTDVLYDFAFPLMDLWHFGAKAAANGLFNCYLHASWPAHADGLRLLPLFLSVRAAIRANVQLTRQQACPHDPAIATIARSYFELACRLMAPPAPRLIAIGGKSGTGKSRLARDVAHRIIPVPGALLLRSDVIRKELSGVDQVTALPRASYTLESSNRVYQVMFERSAHVLAQGVSVILDAAFLKPNERGAVADIARRAGVAMCGLFLSADLDTRLSRVAARRNDASDANVDVVREQDRIDTGTIDWDIVNASGTPAETLELCTPLLQRS